MTSNPSSARWSSDGVRIGWFLTGRKSNTRDSRLPGFHISPLGCAPATRQTIHVTNKSDGSSAPWRGPTSNPNFSIEKEVKRNSCASQTTNIHTTYMRIFSCSKKENGSCCFQSDDLIKGRRRLPVKSLTSLKAFKVVMSWPIQFHYIDKLCALAPRVFTPKLVVFRTFASSVELLFAMKKNNRPN